MINDLLQFLDDSPTPFHATANLTALLEASGYQKWNGENDDGCYFTTRNDSSIIAWHGGQQALESGFRMVGAHTDSPCLKVKPNGLTQSDKGVLIGVEVYGGVLLHPWFDRDLALAGRISGTNKQGKVVSELINIREPLGIIPSLAIHLNRDANKNSTVNAQKHLPVLIANETKAKNIADLVSSLTKVGLKSISDYELSFYDHQGAQLTGISQVFVSSARLDNLLSCFIGATALAADDDEPALLVCNDHEEVGSASHSGAAGPFLASTLLQIAGDPIRCDAMIEKSVLVSADNAHAVHPNYADKHDEHHGPRLNAGPVIKVNSSQRYATNSETAAVFRTACADAKVPVQSFVTRSDMRCGSTIGPITASEIGVPTVDVGIPQLAMHSIRELAGVKDCEYMLSALTTFYKA